MNYIIAASGTTLTHSGFSPSPLQSQDLDLPERADSLDAVPPEVQQQTEKFVTDIARLSLDRLQPVDAEAA